MLHVGVHVKDANTQDKFYKDIPGFHFQWKRRAARRTP